MLTKVKQSIKDSLLFANLIDEHDRKLSWTTITLIVTLGVFTTNTSDPAALGGVLLSLLARGHKKQLASKVDKEQSESIKQLQSQFKEFQNSIKEVQTSVKEIKPLQDSVHMLKTINKIKS